MSDAWTDTLRQKASDIRLLAEWASMVDMGNVRDHLRIAESYIAGEIQRRERMETTK